jgi:hypothetical protein
LELKAQSFKLLKVKSLLTGYSKSSLKTSWLLRQSKVIGNCRALNVPINQQHSGFFRRKFKCDVYGNGCFAG